MSTIAHFSLEHYEHLAQKGAFDGEFRKRVELIHGEILEMTPINVAHSNCVTSIMDWSYEVAPREQFMIRSQNPVRLPMNNSEPEPDVVWVTRKHYQKHPEPDDIFLVIEVADSSLEFDRGEKLSVYAEAGISEYWIVNLIDEQIEVYRNPTGRAYQDVMTYRGGDKVSPLAEASAILQPLRLFSE